MRWRNIGKKITKCHDKDGETSILARFKTKPKGIHTIKIGLYSFTLKKDLILLEIFCDFPRRSFSFKMQYAKKGKTTKGN